MRNWWETLFVGEISDLDLLLVGMLVTEFLCFEFFLYRYLTVCFKNSAAKL
jgi:hypothetical protein